jgi:A/G-specific adenine glycosylase
LPWRRTRDPYAVWVSEVMLQQTRVETVVPYYERFLATFPTVHALAEAPVERVLTLWSGLGYYRRARLLHEGARQLVVDRQGVLPRTAAELAGVRGIGRYTAGAIASIAMNEEAAIVDGNVARVIARVWGVTGDVTRGPPNARVWELAAKLARGEDPGALNQALMELGALVCTPKSPRCDACPARASCVALREDRVAGLPAPRKKAKTKAWRRVALVATGRDGVLLALRSSGAPFAGLWEPVCADGHGKQDARALAARLGVTDIEHVGEIRHPLTHRALTVDVWVGRVGRSWGRRGRRAPPEGYDAVEIVGDDAQGGRPIGALGKRLIARAKAFRADG